VWAVVVKTGTGDGSEKYGMKWKSHVKRFGGYVIDLDEQKMFGDLQEDVWISSETQNRP